RASPAIRSRFHSEEAGPWSWPGTSGPFLGRYTERVNGVPLLAVGSAPLALEPLVSAVATDSDGVDPSTGSGRCGAIVTFLGLAGHHHKGRRVKNTEI